jgi:hypothetical protein
MPNKGKQGATAPETDEQKIARLEGMLKKGLPSAAVMIIQQQIDQLKGVAQKASPEEERKAEQARAAEAAAEAAAKRAAKEKAAQEAAAAARAEEAREETRRNAQWSLAEALGAKAAKAAKRRAKELAMWEEKILARQHRIEEEGLEAGTHQEVSFCGRRFIERVEPEYSDEEKEE